jgi:hypothetical protein
MNINLTTIPLAGIAVIAALVSATSTANAAGCRQHYHTAASGLRLSRSSAIRVARWRWMSRVRQHDGRVFANFRFARNRSITLRRFRNRWHAIAKGRPCMGPGGFKTLTK